LINQFHQHVYAKLSKWQKDSQVISVFFVLLGSSHEKAAHKALVKSTPGSRHIFDISKTVELVYNDHGYNKITAVTN